MYFGKLRSLIFLLLLAGCAGSATPFIGPSPGSMVNFTKLVSIGSRGLFMHCAGPSNGIPIVFINGAGDTLEVWSQIQASLSTAALTCSYDPAGIGSSDPLPGSTTNLAEEASDLHALLAAAQIPSPRLIVGHSIGGSTAVYYAHAYPREVSGAVVLDPTWIPVFQLSILTQELTAASYDPNAVLQEMQSVTSLGSLPLTVLSHDPNLGPAQDPALDAQLHALFPNLETLWTQGQVEIAHLSAKGTQASVPGAWHYIMLAAPQTVLTAIEQLAGIPPGEITFSSSRTAQPTSSRHYTSFF